MEEAEMKWHKHGLVYSPTGELWWNRTHGFIPTVDTSDGGLRVYFTGLDEHQFGRIGYVDLDPKDPSKVLYVTPHPVLYLGELGAFDDSGVNASCIVNVGSITKFMYYIGWQRAVRVPYMLFSGLALSIDGGQSFKRYFRTPIFDRTDAEPYSRSAPFVMLDRDGIKVWYWSCLGWTQEGDWIHYNNVIRHAKSDDGIHLGYSRACIAPMGDDYSVGRPWVVKDGSLYKMWYSIRGRTQPYRMGYAESSDGLNWQRKDDEVGLTVSGVGWDSEMVCFPCVVDVEGKRYMFYNGNKHGIAGFGYAELE